MLEHIVQFQQKLDLPRKCCYVQTKPDLIKTVLMRDVLLHATEIKNNKKIKQIKKAFTLKMARSFSFKEYLCLIAIPSIAISSLIRVKYEGGNGVYFPA